MSVARRALALAAAAVSLWAGIWCARQVPPAADRTPSRNPLLPVLATAPIPAGSKVALSLPPDGPVTPFSPDLYEASWQRPDLLWGRTELWKGPVVPWDYQVVLPGGAFDPREGVEVWRERGIVLRRRTR